MKDKYSVSSLIFVAALILTAILWSYNIALSCSGFLLSTYHYLISRDQQTTVFGKLWNTFCFCKVHRLRIVLLVLDGWNESEGKYFMPQENQMKFKL